MEFKRLIGLCLALAAASVGAQTPVEVPEWAEEQTPSPPAYSKDALIPIEMPSHVTLKVGIDPETVTVGAADGVVRYVVVMRNASGSVSAAYEGILCTKGEVKTYARAGTTGHWVAIDQPQWRPMTDNLPSRHAYAIAKQGGCDGRVSNKREDTIRALKRGKKAYD
ncbi:MAG: CNP1-like family protein [Pseudomonadota bacterium]